MNLKKPQVISNYARAVDRIVELRVQLRVANQRLEDRGAVIVDLRSEIKVKDHEIVIDQQTKINELETDKAKMFGLITKLKEWWERK